MRLYYCERSLLPVINTNDTAQFLIFRVADQPCAAALSGVSEIVLMAELSKPFGPSDVLAGLLNIGGEALPVLHLSRILKLEDSPSTLYSHILLVKTAKATVGFLIAAAEKILAVASSEIKPLKAESVKPFFHTMIPDNKAFVGVLDLQKIAMHYESSLHAMKSVESVPEMVKVAS
ncbi:MAG: chemotaxis protein CheW [Proteobacteria bacterium]|nr:MAG: chemotaxis protein CheW [Pseudomonadota bacterium]